MEKYGCCLVFTFQYFSLSNNFPRPKINPDFSPNKELFLRVTECRKRLVAPLSAGQSMQVKVIF